jgi:type II secretory pathway pseudopilin PulG
LYNDTNTQKGVTLIALAVTIIVMLILAGETISTLIGKGGITSRVTEARDKNAIAKVEEEAQIEYSDLLMNNQIDSIGEDITIGNIKERMERKGYEIKTIGASDSNVIGIELSENNILLKAGESKEVGIIYKYSEWTALKYYIKIKEY